MEILDNYIFNIKSFLIIKKQKNSFSSTQLNNQTTINKENNHYYNQSINSSSYKEIENNFNKLFIYKDKSDLWRICNIIKIINEKAIIKEVTLMELYENEGLYDECILIKSYINQCKIEENQEENEENYEKSVFRLVDIANIKQLKSFLNGLKSFDFNNYSIIDIKHRVSLSKFKNLLWNFFEIVYLSSKNSLNNNVFSDLKDLKIITSEDYSYVKYVYAKKSLIEIVKNLIDLSVYEEKHNKIKENQYENLKNSFFVLSQVQNFPFFRGFQVKFNEKLEFLPIKVTLDRLLTKFSSIFHDFHAFFYDSHEKDTVFEVFFFICSNKNQISDLFFKEIIFIDTNHDKILLFHEKISEIQSENRNFIMEKHESESEIDLNHKKIIYFLIGNRKDIEYIEEIYNILIRLN